MKVLIIPQYSMRSYETGVYSLLADGNLNMVLHQIYTDTKTNEYDICIPENHVKEDLDILVNKIIPMFACKVNFIYTKYGTNADDNRRVVPNNIEIDYEQYAYVISYFENLRPDIPWILKMSMSKIEELTRPYADKHYPALIEALKDNYLIRADVLNYSQYNYIARTHHYLTTLVNVNERCLNKELYSKLANLFVDMDIVNELDKVTPIGAIFFPFRISDKAYDFEKAKSLGRPMVVTDPNESLTDPGVIKLSGNLKTILFSMLYLMNHRRVDISIALYEDCELAVHQLIIELALAVPDSMIGIDTAEIVRRYTF